MTSIFKWINTYLKSQFIKNFSILFSTSIIAQIITVGSSLLLARIYTPDNFGEYTLFTSIMLVLGQVSTFKLDIPVIITKREKNAEILFQVTSLIVLCFCLALTPILLIIGEDYKFTILLVLGILFVGLNQLVKSYLTRRKSFKKIGVADMYRGFSMATIQLAGYLFGANSVFLLLGKVLSEPLSGVFSKNYKFVFSNITLKESINLDFSKKLLLSYKDFPIYTTPQVLVNSFSQNAVVFLFSYFYSMASVGLYGMAFKILQLPLSFISNSIRQVFFQKVSEDVNSGKSVRKILIKTTLGLSLVGIVPFGLIFTYGDTLFSFVLGKNWEVAGIYAGWLSIWLYFAFINPPAMSLLQTLRKQRFLFLYELVYLTLRLLVIVLCAYYLNAIDAIKFMSITGALMNIVLITTAIKLSK